MAPDFCGFFGKLRTLDEADVTKHQLARRNGQSTSGEFSSVRVIQRVKTVPLCSANVCRDTLRFSQSSGLVIPCSSEAAYYPSPLKPYH
ncbi:hypothetical protein TNIN_454241 [Trichonephila inaurata madagascariensis]|uniref:Uncharacterized protein n=1 Tax=Trichonephila inaurata madagascariensis TaxID=2747483 RepID=A0A8X7CHH0_9ARAC|nr:hypothetical protein TNIN_454241 [Trichonephila inaurata madagascariensis]